MPLVPGRQVLDRCSQFLLPLCSRNVFYNTGTFSLHILRGRQEHHVIRIQQF
jgi:hypothetical protein